MSPPPSSFGGFSPNRVFGLFFVLAQAERAGRLRQAGPVGWIIFDVRYIFPL
jgi:hypothetical protein